MFLFVVDCGHLVSVSRRIILGTDDQTTTLLGTSVNSLDNIDELLFIFEDPVEFIIVSGAEIAHHVFISEEEHDGTRIVEFCRRGSQFWDAREEEKSESVNVPYIWLKSGT